MARRRVGSVLDLPDQEEFDAETVRDLADFGMYQETAQTDTPRATENQFEEIAIEPPIYEDVRQLPPPPEFEDYSQDQLSGLSNLPLEQYPSGPREMFDEGFEIPENPELVQMRQRQYDNNPPSAREMIEGGYEPPVNEEMQAIKQREEDEIDDIANRVQRRSGYAYNTVEDARDSYLRDPEGILEWLQWEEANNPDIEAVETFPKEDFVNPAEMQQTEQALSNENTVTPEQETAINSAINNDQPIITVNSIDRENIPQDAQPIQGAVDTALANPYVKEELIRISQIGKIDPEIESLANQFEKISSLDFNDLNPEEKTLFEKMINGELSTGEKIGLGIAILAPLIIGAMYGASGLGIGASSALNNFANIAFSKQDISEKKEKFEKGKKSQLDNIQDRLKVKKDFLGKETTDQVAKKFLMSRPGMQFGDELGISAGDENNVLWVNTREIKDDEDVKRIRGVEEEAKKTLGIVNNTIRQVDELEEVLQAIEDKDPGYLNILANNWSWLSNDTPDKSLANKFAEAPYITIRDKDGKSRQVNALRYAKQIATGLQDNYGKSILKGNKLTQQVLGHWESIFFDPTSLEDFRQGGIKGWLESIKGFKNLTNRKIVDELTSNGFVRQPLEAKYPTIPMQIVKTGKATQQDIARNPEKYKKYER